MTDITDIKDMLFRRKKRLTGPGLRPLYPPLSAILWLMLSLILVMLPHIPRLPVWVPFLFLLLISWRFLCTWKNYPLPSAWLQLLFAILVITGVIFTYHTLFGRDAGIAMLVALCGLKVLEMHNRRDALLLCFLGYFLIITNFLYSQDIPTALYMLVVMVVTTTTLISLSDINQSLSVRQRLRYASTMLAQSLPLALALFILFPRIEGQFWQLPRDAHNAVTGLSDNMTIGNISEISLSDEVAFRVRFNGSNIPSTAIMYWRGPVLWLTDGRTWTTGFHKNPQAHYPQVETRGEPVDYTITLEPHNERWLLAMDMPASLPTRSGLSIDYQLLAEQPVQNRMRYDMVSYPDYRARTIDDRHQRMALQLPNNRHPRARQLARQWIKEVGSDAQALANRALQYFNEVPFIYSYTPPALWDDPIDEFLFTTRQGFCEHYAAAFVVLMRAAGVPARVVTGYQGGTMNPVDNYLIVRQRDAHAWAEIWTESEGWIRVDPTSAVAPERIERGIDNAIPQSFAPMGISIDRESPVAQLWQKMRYTWDAFNNSWNQWVLGYDAKEQRALMNWLGLEDVSWRALTVLMVITMIFILIGISLWIFSRQTVRRDPAQRLYQRFCHRLARRGLPREASEGPHTYANRASVRFPLLAERIEHITELYVQIRYRSQPQQLAALQQAVSRFR